MAKPNEIKHYYGDKIHILDDPLAKVGHKKQEGCRQKGQASDGGENHRQQLAWPAIRPRMSDSCNLSCWSEMRASLGIV